VSIPEPKNKIDKREIILPRWLRNTLIFPLLVLNGWALSLLIDYLQPLISIVLMSIILAIVLDYPVGFLQRRGLARMWSLTIVIVLAIAVLPILGFVVIPIVLAFGFGVVLAVIFTIMRVPLAIMFAFLIALGSLFPFMGGITQTSVSFFIMLQNFTIGLQVFLIALVLGQILDEVILPKVMGDIVGVNPIWLIVAVFLGIRLGGIVGILLAVPVASVIKDLVDDMLISHKEASASADSSL